MALTYNKNIRDLSIKGTITLNTGRQIHLTTDDIVSYSFDSQIGSEGLPLGSAESSTFSLEIVNRNHQYLPSQFDNAEVHMFVGIKNGADFEYSDFGVWYVDNSSAPEQSVSISLSGYDALASRFEAVFTDDSGSYPSTIGRIASVVCLAAGIRLKTADFPNAGLVVSKMPEWGEDTTLRDILSYCAICAGGYVRIARNGQLEIVGFMDGKTYEINPDMYQTFTLTGGTEFKFNSIEAMLDKDSDEYSRYAINGNISSNATNTIQIEYNPLLTDSIIQSIVNELSGIEMEAGTISWGGDPSVMCTDFYSVTMLDGTVHKMMLTSQSFSFDGGMTVTESCDLPAINSSQGATYSTSTNMYDAKGNLKASRISGLDKRVIDATVGHFEQLTAESAEIDELLAAFISAVNLIAGKIDASVIKAGTITSDKLDVGVVDAVTIDAIAAKIESLSAEDIATDRLAAALAAFTVVTAGNASFDQATIKHLVSQAMNLEYGVAEQVFIKNLAVEYAQMVGAAIGELCIKASDGNYYLVDVSPNGTVTATRTTVSDGEVTAGQTSGGKMILETNITAANLNAGNLLATYALINQIDAARIDVDQLFAREAFISLLRTSNIIGGESITMIAERASKSFRQEDMPTDGIKPGDTWRIPSTGQTYQAEDASEYGLKFYLDTDGSIHYELVTDDGSISLKMQDYDLEIDGIVLQNDADGNPVTPIRWVLVQDSNMMSKQEFEHYVRVAPDGLHVGTKIDPVTAEVLDEPIGEVVIDHDSVDIVLGGNTFSSFTGSYVAFGNYQIRKTADGGIAFKMR